MATTLQLIQGSTTVDLYNGTTTKTLKDWGFGSGGYMDLDTTTETVEVQIKQTTNALLLSTRSSIVAILEQARLRQGNPVIDPVYIKFQPEGAASAWRSEILDYQQVDPGDIYGEQWLRHDATISITWMRRNFWEANAETQIPLTNSNRSNYTEGGIEVYNTNDGTGNAPNKRVNYIEIAAADVTGDLPAPVRMEITNPHASMHIFQVWIGQSWNISDYANLPHILEAETTVTGTTTNSANYSGGAYKSLTLAAGEVQTYIFPLTDAQVTALRGGWYHVLARFGGSWTNSTLVKTQVRVRFVATDWSTQEVFLGGGWIRDLFTVRIPPWIPGQSGMDGVSLVIYLTNTSAYEMTIPVDFFALLPAEGYRCLYAAGYGCDPSYRIVDDGINDRLYVDDGAGTNKNGVFVPYGGKPIQVMPGKLQRLYFHMRWDAELAQVEVLNYTTIKMYYRPRRLHI